MTSDPRPKRPYFEPLLKTYGTLTQLTNSVGTTSMNADGGTMSLNKTK